MTAGFAATLGIIHYVPHHAVFITALLLLFWAILFWPLSKTDLFVFIIASVFFLAQNYSVLSVGGFRFLHQDFLLMPAYEPFLWGFYFLLLKKGITDTNAPQKVTAQAVTGLILTAVCFTAFAKNSTLTLYASIFSTLVLFLLFHDKCDMCYGFTALNIGIVVEIFGVQTGLWSYPKPDILGIPYWFITMWLSAGLLGRRFLNPLAYTLTKRGHSKK